MKRLFSVILTAAMLFCGCNGGGAVSVSAENSSAEVYTADDLTVLCDLILSGQTAESGKNYDLNSDGRLDAFDMCLLRQIAADDRQEYDTFNITANGTTFTAKFADNSGAEAFRELLKKGDLTINMHDYGSFEKVGDIGTTLPRNDERITTEPGDVILYQGTSITVYYDKNTWNFTRLGRIGNVTREQLLDAFGDGSVDMTFSLK